MADWHPDHWADAHGGRLRAMVPIAIDAGNDTRQSFRQPTLVVDVKSDDSPVTIADRRAEEKTRQWVAEQFPDDAIAGEEFDETSGTTGYRWTVDPIDGTKSFICGVPLYSTLLALELDGQPIGGAIVIPALGEAVVAATGMGCFYSPDLKSWSTARVSSQTDLKHAIFVTSEVKTFADRGDADVFERLQAATWLTRTWGDGYGYLMVATGRADLMVDPICNPWDVAAMLPILGESGGRFTDWKGTPTARSGEGIGTNGHLHDAALTLLSR